MGNRTIHAPGVEIIEHDLSSYTTTNLGTGCLITGFAQKGEDLQPMKITNRTSWLLNFGAPTNEAEEYFYNAGMEVLNQGGFLYAAKIPYSNDMTGIYAASKFKISAVTGLYNFDEEQGQFYYDELNEEGEREYVEDEAYQVGNASFRFCKSYHSLKDLGLNSIQRIAPAAQDFISKDLVEEYETGESTPASNVIYLVDKTRAIYTRATEVSDVQENRDSRSCIGIVPVITTLCNTAWYQKKTTGVESDVDELYQPVRSLKTITFPAGAASAAEYLPTKFVESDLHTQLMKTDSTFNVSLSERAATIAQSCLVNGNLVDGKFKPYIANDVAVVVFKAFVSTEDGKIDFDVAETWVGSLDPKGRDEKGRTTFIDTIINNSSEYIYCFSNLENPEQVLNPDHGFVVGSDSEYDTVKENLVDSQEYLAATLFSAYAAKMLGFGDEVTLSEETGLAAPRDFAIEADQDIADAMEDEEWSTLAKATLGALRQFYNQDAKTPVCVVDELVKGGSFDAAKILEKYGDSTEVRKALEDADLNGYLTVPDKFIVEEPSVVYTIVKADSDKNVEGKKGCIKFAVTKDEADAEKFTLETYDYEFTMGDETNPQSYLDVDISQMELSELTILNSTDYLRAITDFDDLVDVDSLAEQTNKNLDDVDSPEYAQARCKAIQSLIINSIEKSGRFKAKLRYLKKAKVNVDKLDMYFKYANLTATSDNKSDIKIGQQYINDIYKAYLDTGLVSGITFTDTSSSSSSAAQTKGASLLEKKDALEAKLDSIINSDTTKKEKMKPRGGNGGTGAITDLTTKYLAVKTYLMSQYYSKLSDMYDVITSIMEDCAYAQDRYVESQRNIDDATIMLGFYPEMATPTITYTTIAQSLNKIFDTMGDVHTSEIDVVCDAGVSNIAQFVKQVYDPSADDGEDVGGEYEPVKSASYFKFNKNTDLAYWKTIVYKFDTFCKYRGDCMFCTEGPRHLVLTGNKQVVRTTKKDTSVDLNILPYLSKVAGFNTSYGAGYLNWYRTISDYTGDTLWVPPSIAAMGTYILTDKQYNWWDAPAGMRRGVINLVDTAFNPNKTQAGEIYDTNWNYAINYLNDGIIQEGQKTFQTRQSALDRVNVRRLLGRIKRYVYFASRQFLYEPHTAAVREKYVKTLDPFFKDLVNRGGLYDYKIICDSSNNTSEVIDRNELRVKIGIKPVKTIEFIIVDLCVLNTGASWSEMDSV